MDETQNTSASTKNRSGLIIAILVLLLAAGVGAWFYFDKGAATPGEETRNDGEVVARVNGHEIKRAEYDRTYAQLVAAYTTQGVDVSAEESTKMIKEQTINSLINRQLLAAAAAEKNYTTTEATIEDEYQKVVAQAGGEETFRAALEAAGLDEAAVREDIRNGILIQQYLNETISIDQVTVTDAEVKTYYDQAKGTNTQLPPLEEVAAVIKEQLLAQKKDLQINTELEKMRAEANIEILI